jgi:hypothetical protein
MKILATVATLSLGVGAAFAQGLPAGFHEPAYGSQAFSAAPLSLDVRRCLRSRQCRSHRDVRGSKRVASAEIGKLFCGSAWIRDREWQYWFNGYQYPPRFRRSGLPHEQPQWDDHVASPGRCSAGGYDTKVNQLAPAARSRKGRRVLVARLDASKSLCRFGSAGGRIL